MIISLDKYKATGGGGEKPTEVLTKTITENGSQTFNPKAGYVFSKATITTDVHPTEALIATINENGSRHFDGEYNGAEITVNVATFTPTGNIDINANGSYDVANYATANVNVQSSDNYSYFDGVIDVDGLRAIGWDDESIGMFRDNDRHYAWQNSDYIVSEENKALYGVVTQHTSLENYPYAVFAPKIKYFTVSDSPAFFRDCKTLKAIPKSIFQNCRSFQNMFKGCSSLITIPLIKSQVPVTTMQSMFYGCSSLTSIPLLDASKVTNTQYMFYSCSSLTSIPLLNTSNVTSMQNMFENCSSLTSIPQLDTSNVTSMTSMFEGCSSLTYIPLLDTSKVTNMSYMFNSCSSLTSIPLLNTGNVTSMNDMFISCSSLTSIPSLDTSKVTTMSEMFNGCSSLTSIPQLDTIKVKNMSRMVFGCSSLTSISLLDTSNVTDMSYFFGYGNMNKLTYLGGFKNLSISVASYFLDNCPNLTVESLMNVINNLATVSGKTLKFGSTNLNKLTAEQIAIATAKGWTLT